MSSGTDRVAVTGLGAVSCFGWRAEDLWQALREGRSGIAEPERFDVSGQRTGLASEVPEPPPELAAGGPGWRRLSRADRFAVVAAREAVAAAGLDPSGWRDEDELRVGVWFGGSTAGMAEGERFLSALLGKTSERPRISLLASQPLNGPGDAVARDLGVTGPVISVSSACSSGTLALGAALDALRDGEVDVAIAGGSDALCQLTYSGFNALRAVDERPCRPFRSERGGLSLGEGAGVLVLERESDARRRGAVILARLLGAGASCDAHHMTAPHPEGVGAAAAIRRALEDARIGPGRVGFVNAHGTGTPLNDASESRALAAVFGERARQLPVTSTKGAIGHFLGSAGAIEAVATVLCLKERSVHPTPGGDVPDPELGVALVVGRARPLADDERVAVSTNLAFGGANAAVVLEACGVNSGPDDSEEIVISGLGAVTSVGVGHEAVARALAEGRPRLQAIPRDAGYHRPDSVAVGALVDPAELRPWLPPAKARRMSPPSRLAVVAARMALEEAGLGAEPAGEEGDPDLAVVLATSYGPSSYTERILRQVLDEGPQSASPMLFTESVANAPAAQVALLLRALGPNITVTQREAGALQAVEQAVGLVRKGRARRVLAGGVEELNPLLHAVLDRYGALASETEGDAEAGPAIPYDRHRRGFLAAEGAVVGVVERASDARARGVDPDRMVSVVTATSAFDPTATATAWGSGHARLARSLARHLAARGLDEGTIDLVIGGGSGAKRGDAADALTLRALFGEALPPVAAPKAVLGEFCGAGLISAVFALRGEACGVVAGFREVDPELGIRPTQGSGAERPRRVLVQALAVGGAASWLVLGRAA